MFLHYLLDYIMDDLAQQSHGTTMQHIKKSDLRPFQVALPAKQEQSRIAQRMKAVDEVVDAETSYGNELVLLKTALMQDLLTGAVRVPEAEAAVQEVVA